MKTFAVKEKRPAPAIVRARPYVHAPFGSVQRAQQARIGRILRSTGAQARLTIGQPNDKYEQEADRVADKVMAMPDPGLQRQPENEEEEEEPLQAKFWYGEMVQRMCPKCEEEQLQTKEQPGRMPGVTPNIESRIHSMKSGGQPLDPVTRSFFEPRFGRDFSDVRLHTDSTAADTARSIHARAFTLGNHVVMASGEYYRDSLSGRQLLGHELTHVVQQSFMRKRIQRRTDQVIQEPHRRHAQACLVHLHGNEVNALNVARNLYRTHCVNLVYIQHPVRLINVDVPGHSGLTCRADPNRIFDDAAISSEWSVWNSGRCTHGTVIGAAQAAVKGFRNNVLNPRISQCRGQSVSNGQIRNERILGTLPVAVFHNNTPGSPTARPVRSRGNCNENLTIRSYLTGHCEAAATETARARTYGYRNPNIISSEDVDNFYLVTDPRDFLALRRRRNVVLQSLSAPNDGSLSVALRSGRYVNIEVEGTRRTRRLNQAMGVDALSALGVSRLPCPTGAPAIIQRVGNPITERNLPSPSARGISRSEQSLRRFMREVFRRQVTLWTASGSTYLHEVPASELVTLSSSYSIPGRTVSVHRDIQHPVINMINDARSALFRANGPSGSATGIRNVGIRSGYRSATSQFGIWTTWAPRYYRNTRAVRRDRTQFPSGEHSGAAAQYLAEYINQRVYSPGYSPHQYARTVDVSFQNGSGWAPADTSAAWISRWQTSWFFGWLKRNAFHYGFFQNPNLNEPWHWEFNPLIASILLIIQRILDLLEPWIGQRKIWFGNERTEGEANGEEQDL